MALILLYHRVTQLERDPQLLAVSPQNFAAHLHVVKQAAHLSSLRQIVSDLQRGSVDPRGVAITFDDGYLDNLQQAAPLLDRHSAPATVFATAGRRCGEGEFFWDELERIILSPSCLPAQARFAGVLEGVGGNLGAGGEYTADECERHRDWNVLRPDDPTQRHTLYRHLCGRLHSLSIAAREDALSAIRNWAHVDAKSRETHRMMSGNDLGELSRSELIDIGGHTVDHPRLVSESVAEQRRQITTNRSAIAAAIGRSPRGFSYPFGTRHDYSAETMGLVKEAGYDFACSNFTGRVTADCDPYQLPRFIVRDWGADEFGRQLMSWFER